MAADGVWTLYQGDCDQRNHRNSHTCTLLLFCKKVCIAYIMIWYSKEIM